MPFWIAAGDTKQAVTAILRNPQGRLEMTPLFKASARRLVVDHAGLPISAGLLAVLCWLLAHWTWVVLAPAAVVVQPSRPQPVDLVGVRDAVTAARLFDRGAPTEVPEIRAATTQNLRLAGLATARGGKGSYAVISVNNKRTEVVAPGSEIAPGIVLHQVLTDHVVVRRHGTLERIDLFDAGRKPAGASGFALGVQRQPGGAYDFSRVELNRALQNPAQHAHMGAFSVHPGAGVRIDQAPEGSLAWKLGLLPGDQISKVNGEAVSTQDDLLRLYQRFGQVGQIALEGARNGSPLNLKYVVQQ